MAAAYESCIYPALCNLYGEWHSTSLKQLAQDISDIVGSPDGIILDAACGPGTYGSASLLRQGPFLAWISA